MQQQCGNYMLETGVWKGGTQRAVVRVYRWGMKPWEGAAVDGICWEDNLEGEEHRVPLTNSRETRICKRESDNEQSENKKNGRKRQATETK